MDSRQRCLRLWKPEGHAHEPQELQGGGQFGAGLLPATYPAIQDAKAEVTVGLERAHAEICGQGKSLAVVFSRMLALWRLTLRRNLAEEAQGIRLVATFLVHLGMHQRPLCKNLRLLQAAGQ